jgi:hypothetical protein
MRRTAGHPETPPATDRRAQLWKCPRCGHRFVTRNLWHSCGRYALASHFKGKDPILRSVFDRIHAAVTAVGPATTSRIPGRWTGNSGYSSGKRTGSESRNTSGRRSMGNGFYGTDLAYIHDSGHLGFARHAAAGILRILAKRCSGPSGVRCSRNY